MMRGVLATVCVCQVSVLSRLAGDWWRVGVHIRHLLTSVLLASFPGCLLAVS